MNSPGMGKSALVVSNGHPTVPELAVQIERLRASLKGLFGCDYSFSIAAQGHLLAASNIRDGVVLAVAQVRRSSEHKRTCEFFDKPEWSGSPVRGDTAWKCDSCGVIISAKEG